MKSDPITEPAAGPRFLSPKDVYKRVCMSRATVHRRVQAGTFPQPVRLGANRKVWLESSILAWIDAQVRGSSFAPSK